MLKQMAEKQGAEQKVSVLLKDVDGNDVLADGEAANTDDKLSF